MNSLTSKKEPSLLFMFANTLELKLSLLRSFIFIA